MSGSGTDISKAVNRRWHIVIIFDSKSNGPNIYRCSIRKNKSLCHYAKSSVPVQKQMNADSSEYESL